MDSRQDYPGVALAVDLLIVLAYLIFVFCLFIIFTMDWLDPFSLICMSKAGVMVTTIWHKDAVNSFVFCIHQMDIVCSFCSSLLSVQFRPFILFILVEYTILIIRFIHHC